MKIVRIAVICLSVCLSWSFSSGVDIDKQITVVRAAFFDAIKDQTKASLLRQKIERLNSNSSLLQVYQGATYAIMAKDKWNPFSAIRLLKKSNLTMNQAVKASPSDLEIRFIRFAVQKNIPSFLGYSDNMTEDKSYILKNIDRFNSSVLSRAIKDYILSFMKEQAGYNAEELALIIVKFEG